MLEKKHCEQARANGQLAFNEFNMSSFFETPVGSSHLAQKTMASNFVVCLLTGTFVFCTFHIAVRSRLRSRSTRESRFLPTYGVFFSSYELSGGEVICSVKFTGFLVLPALGTPTLLQYRQVNAVVDKGMLCGLASAPSNEDLFAAVLTEAHRVLADDGHYVSACSYRIT